MSTPQRYALVADAVFDGSTLRRGCALILEANGVVALAPRGDLPAGIPVHELPGDVWLAPGFIDVQVNGGGDV
ncbi:MAG: N-acetylglucosamine-6-phosphate deacetylase, partial [Alphaproteobacteria bacterium]|nr:N-acetylglucosamine-6-phosphate deacetylase [Alphaproteobacteria bacterium]